jgi:ribonuclease G
LQKDIIINVSEHETRLAILEDLKLVELLVERPEKERMVGDIYHGVVKAVLPGMQAAFIDMGLDKSAFLHFSDIGDFTSQLDLLYEAADYPTDPQAGTGDFCPGHQRAHRHKRIPGDHPALSSGKMCGFGSR